MPSRRLADHTTLRLGGTAESVSAVHDEKTLIDAVRGTDAAGEPLLLIAGGSNLVITDDDVPGSVLLVRTGGVEHDGDLITVAAGEPWDPFVARCAEEGRPGIACLSGIPGSVGATPIQNVGAYGQEGGEVVEELRVLDRRTGAVSSMRGSDAQFGYRRSVLKREPGRWVVLDVTFRLPRDPHGAPVRYGELARLLGTEPGRRVPAADLRAAVIDLRRAKGMVLDPRDSDTVSAGSFFTNPILDETEFFKLERRVEATLGPGAGLPGYPTGSHGRMKTSAAWLIDHSGFEKGYGRPDGIAISSRHVLALTNRGSGTTAELLALAHEIAGGVEQRWGVALTPEPVLVGCSW